MFATHKAKKVVWAYRAEIDRLFNLYADYGQTASWDMVCRMHVNAWSHALHSQRQPQWSPWCDEAKGHFSVFLTGLSRRGIHFPDAERVSQPEESEEPEEEPESLETLLERDEQYERERAQLVWDQQEWEAQESEREQGT
jgi:hypothetical protein